MCYVSISALKYSFSYQVFENLQWKINIVYLLVSRPNCLDAKFAESRPCPKAHTRVQYRNI